MPIHVIHNNRQRVAQSRARINSTVAKRINGYAYHSELALAAMSLSGSQCLCYNIITERTVEQPVFDVGGVELKPLEGTVDVISVFVLICVVDIPGTH